MNPFGEIREFSNDFLFSRRLTNISPGNEDHTLFERGRGNVCSVEFNCLYRWHATTSAQDEKWVETVFTNLFEGKPADDVSYILHITTSTGTYDFVLQITIKDFKVVAKKIKESEPDIQHWTFGG